MMHLTNTCRKAVLLSTENSTLMVEALPPLHPKGIVSQEDVVYLQTSIGIISDLFHVYGFDKSNFNSLNTLKRWAVLSSYSSPMKFLKYKIAAFFSAWTEDEVPDAPFPHGRSYDNPRALLGGKAYRWLLLQKQTMHPETFLSLVTSVLYSKKGLPRPTTEMLREAEVKAFETMTTPLPQQKPFWLRDWADENGARLDGLISKETVQAQLRRTVSEIFKGVSLGTTMTKPQPFFPSVHSAYDCKRANGGAMGSLGQRHLYEAAVYEEDKKLCPEHVLGEGWRHVSHTVTNHEGKVIPELERGITFGSDGKHVAVDQSLLDTRFQQFWSKLKEHVDNEIPYVAPVALAEPLKIRGISKGPAGLYTFLKPFQKFMWRQLQKFRPFSLTGMPVTEREVQRVMGSQLKGLQRWLSVDYSAATDNLHMWASETVADQICKDLDCEWLYPYFQRALTGHIYVPPDCEPGHEDLVAKPQRRGQLMGSVVSFIVLCIVNGSICRWVTELDYDRQFKLNDCPLMINGDDGLLKVTPVGRQFWSRISSFCGLEPSIGKVYFSKTIANINSTTFLYRPDGFSDVETHENGRSFTYRRMFENIKYVNLGLMYGLGRSTSTEEETEKKDRLRAHGTDNSIGARARELIKDCPVGYEEIVMQKYILNNHSTLVESRLPWFVPEHMGGLGLPEVGRYHCDDKHRRLLRILKDEGRFPEQRPIVPSWLTWKAANKALKTMEPLCNSDFVMLQSAQAIDLSYEAVGPGALSLEDIAGKVCVDLLFTEKIKDLYCPAIEAKPGVKPEDYDCYNKAFVTEKRNVDRYLRSIQRFWAKLYRSTTYPEPLSDLSECPKKWSVTEQAKIYQLMSVVDNDRREVTLIGDEGQVSSLAATTNAVIPPRHDSQTVFRSFHFDSIRSEDN